MSIKDEVKKLLAGIGDKENEGKLAVTMSRYRVQTLTAMRSAGGPKWELEKGALSGPGCLVVDDVWFRFPNGVEFPFESVCDEEYFEFVSIQ